MMMRSESDTTTCVVMQFTAMQFLHCCVQLLGTMQFDNSCPACILHLSHSERHIQGKIYKCGQQYHCYQHKPS